MRIVLVVNSTAGSMAAGLTPQIIRAKVAAAGFDICFEPDETAALPERFKAAAAQSGIEAVVAAGGDGTMACAASVLAGRGLPLGLLPLGTMNLLAKDLGLPSGLDAAIANLAAGEVKQIDVAEVNGHVFLISSILGLPARLAGYREAQRGHSSLQGAMRFSAAFFRHLWRYPRLRITGFAGDQKIERRFHMLAVVNNDFVERPGQILVRDPVDSGRLTLYALPRLTLWRLLRLASGLAAGHWHGLPGLERFEAQTLEIGSKRRALRVMNDGEVRLVETPLQYRIHRQALAVIVPRATA